MREFKVEFFVPRHFAFFDFAVVFFHVFEVSLSPLALPLFKRNVIDGEFLVTKYIRGVYYVQSRVFYIHRKRDVFRDDERETARFFVTFAAYGHAVPDKRVRAVKVFNYLYGFAVTAYAKPHKPLKDVAAFLRFVPCLNRSAIFIVSEIFKNFAYIVFRNDFVAVQNDEIVVIRPIGKVIVEIARLVTDVIFTPYNLYAFATGGVTVYFVYILGF